MPKKTISYELAIQPEQISVLVASPDPPKKYQFSVFGSLVFKKIKEIKLNVINKYCIV